MSSAPSSRSGSGADSSPAGVPGAGGSSTTGAHAAASSHAAVAAPGLGSSTPASTRDEVSTDEDEFEISKVDRDVRDILNVEQSHISHVGLMENLRQFYLAHNPRILQSPNFLRDLVSLFEGREKELFEKLEETYQTNDPMAFVHSSHTSNGRAPVNFLKNITMEGRLFRKPTLKGVRGKVQEIMEPHERWFELCGSLLVWSKGPKNPPRGKLRLVPLTIVEPIGDRNFRIKTAGKILLMCQAKTKALRDEWVSSLHTTLEHLAMEAKQAKLSDKDWSDRERATAVDGDVSRLTDVDSDDDDMTSGGGGGRATHKSSRGSRRSVRLTADSDSSSDEDTAVAPMTPAIPAVVQLAVAPSIVQDPAADDAMNAYRGGVRSSLQIAKRKILSASGIVAVTALAMQYYGLVPVIVSGVVGLICIYARFFDVRDAPPQAAGSVVLRAVAGAPAVLSPVSITGMGAPKSSNTSRPVSKGSRSKSARSSRRKERGSKHTEKRNHSSDDEGFTDCVNESMMSTPATAIASAAATGGASKEQESKTALVESGDPPLHLYGELGVRFLPNEPGIVPRGLSFKLNDDYHPVDFETPFFKGRMVMRIKDAIGAPATPYFEGKRRLFSIQVEGRFKERLRTDRVLFGSSFKHKISMPRGASVAMSILRGIDPALRDDLFADENPWIMSPLVCAVERLQVRKADPNDHEFNGLGPWRYGGNVSIEEDSSLLLSEEKRQKMGDKKMSFGQRRKYFADIKKREATFWEPDLVYTFDFLSARMDFNTYRVKMAKFIEFGTTKLMNNQPFQLEARVMDEADLNKKIGAMWAFEFCHNKVAPFNPNMEVIDHSNDL